MSVITRFTEAFEFLSNFYPSRVMLDDVEYPSVEHAFQAAKTLDLADRRRIRICSSPGKAKRMGKTVSLRSGWEQMKYDVMKDLLRQKFARGQLREKLLATGGATLVEGNTWGDKIWGMVDGVGQNAA